jgi:isochorismate pyruvate lyase
MRMEAGISVTFANTNLESDMQSPPSSANNQTFNAPHPNACRTMIEVRAGVDEVDERLLGLLARRFGYAVASSRIKQSRAAVRDEERIAKVLANAVTVGSRLGVPVDIVEPVWRAMIESFVTREQAMFDARAARGSSVPEE